ncbi:MAG TPA: ATP-binding protein [Flavisolibacter sp.]
MEALKDARAWLTQHAGLRQTKTVTRKSSRGHTILFLGPPSSRTSKRTTAEMLGNEFGKEIYRVELSQVVGEYIGETEKNLAAVFKKAADNDSILFFDEADALFGRRTEVRDAHDRYANAEVSYLLQRLEDHPGLVILAANLKGTIDPAFTRRFQTVVKFPRVRSASK